MNDPWDAALPEPRLDKQAGVLVDHNGRVAERLREPSDSIEDRHGDVQTLLLSLGAAPLPTRALGLPPFRVGDDQSFPVLHVTPDDDAGARIDGEGDVEADEPFAALIGAQLVVPADDGGDSEAGKRTIALFPSLRRLLLTWKIKSPRTGSDDYVISTFDGSSVQQRNLRRILQKAKEAAGMDATEDRLSWHSLRHSAGSIWLTEYGIPVTPCPP